MGMGRGIEKQSIILKFMPPHFFSKVFSDLLKWPARILVLAASSGCRVRRSGLPSSGPPESTSASPTAERSEAVSEKRASVRVGNQSGDVFEARSSLTHRFPRTVSAFHLH